MKLTDAFVSAVQPTESVVVYRDDEQPGFCVRIYPTGVKIWYFESRIRGRLYNRKIAPVAVYKTREARALAKQWAGELVQGIDSQKQLKERDREATREASQRRRAETLSQAADTYLRTVELKPSSVGFYKKLLQGGLKRHSNLILKEITPDDIREIAADISERNSPLQAGKCVRFIRTLCLWRELPNPMPNRIRLAASKPRQARLEPEDGAKIWKALQSLVRKPSGAYLAVMLLTGCRTSELSNLTVGQVDFGSGSFQLANTKNGRDHKVYMSAPVLAIVSRLSKGKQVHEPVFAESKEGRTARKNMAYGKQWSNHDLRKLFAITAMEIGVPYPVIKAALNHSTGDVTLAHYAHATPTQLRSCWDRVAAFYTREQCTNSQDLKTFSEPLYEPQNGSTSNSTSTMQHLVLQERLESLPTASNDSLSTASN
jgi:integrase